MVNIIDNRSTVTAKLLGFESDQSRNDLRILELEIAAVGSVEGYPQLVDRAPGQSLKMYAHRDYLAQPLRIGATYRFPVMATGPATYFLAGPVETA